MSGGEERVATALLLVNNALEALLFVPVSANKEIRIARRELFVARESLVKAQEILAPRQQENV